MIMTGNILEDYKEFLRREREWQERQMVELLSHGPDVRYVPIKYSDKNIKEEK